MSNNESVTFAIHDARKLIMHLAKPNHLIYWIDLFVTLAIGWGAFVLTLVAPVSVIVRILLGVTASLALYRASIFTHELTHLPSGSFRAFRIVWNLLCGFALMIPAFVYQGVHTEHHVRAIYGRDDDGEYWPFVHRQHYQITAFPLVSMLLPLYFAVRFIILTPLMLLNRKIRKFGWEWMSSLAIIAKYRRELPNSRQERAAWIVQEWMTWAYGVGTIVLAIIGIIPYAALLLWYGVIALSFVLNALRTLVAHKYRNPGDVPMDETEQVLDSVNITGVFAIPALWAPLGLRYHATHHLFMRIPYHRLGEAHRTLMRELPEESEYRGTVYPSLWRAFGTLWRDAGSKAQPLQSH